MGHTDVVRSLVRINSVGFASCSNDRYILDNCSSIRIWENSGHLLQELYGHTSFVYSLTCLASGELISSGEDRTVRIWKNGVEIQTISLPCVSVWTVDSLPNGDIVVGGSDCLVRIFTMDPSRAASAEERAV
jgi:phospholipase A-2-activating protein